jgi:ATP-binding cassette subfamily C protein
MRGWREGIGYVAQDTVLFHDSVRENLRWARPDATDDELWEALRASAADGFVAALPEGIATVVGDRGVRLSGGERQRLALARALLRRPSLLILDEATSALDTENERRIRDAIAALHGRVTILLITHRLSSVRDADAIHVMEGGGLIESGDWPSLLAKPGGRFRALWQSQEADEVESPRP